MTEQRVPRCNRAVEDSLNNHLERFLATLAAAGYVETTQHEKRRLIVPFIRWAGKAGFGDADLDDSKVAAFLSRPSRRRWHHGDSERVALRQFLEHLRKAGVSPLPCPVVPSSDEVLIRRYLKHLRGDRGLCPRSIEVYEPFARAFVKTQRLPERLDALDASAVRAQLLDYSRGHSVSSVKLLAAGFRSFLRFLFLSGATSADLSAAVLPVRRWRLAAVPPFLTAEEVERAIAATDRSTARGRRAAAVLLLLARLGLRAGEVVALELDDIHWDVGEIVVRGKGRVYDRLPLLDDVGEALALYLRESRGPSSSRRVFLRRCAPHVGLSGPTAVCLIAREAMRRAGLRPKGRVGAHIFRHSLARRMLQCGASLGEIAQVLRHRSIEATQLYAKVELEALGSVALPWPTAEVPR
jgi:integrase/recombinase XerD